jgi:hypothetical protein
MDLGRVADVWDGLPEHVRMAILSLAGVPPLAAQDASARKGGRGDARPPS